MVEVAKAVIAVALAVEAEVAVAALEELHPVAEEGLLVPNIRLPINNLIKVTTLSSRITLEIILNNNILIIMARNTMATTLMGKSTMHTELKLNINNSSILRIINPYRNLSMWSKLTSLFQKIDNLSLHKRSLPINQSIKLRINPQPKNRRLIKGKSRKNQPTKRRRNPPINRNHLSHLTNPRVITSQSKITKSSRTSRPDLTNKNSLM